MAETLRVTSASEVLIEGTAAIVVPSEAVDDPSLIRMVSTAGASTAKHDVHALSQMALFDFEDGMLEAREAAGPLIVEHGPEPLSMEKGVVVARDLSGAPRLFATPGADVRRLLKEAHRFCTRWIRLDVG